MPLDFGIEDFFEAYVWAVYNSGLKVEVLDALWSRMEAALRGFSVFKVAEDREAVEQELLSVMGNTGKAEGVMVTAAMLARRPQIWDRFQRMSGPSFLDEVQATFKGVGPENRYHIARNLGWDVATHSGFTKALAVDLGTDCDTLVSYLARVSSLKVRTTDMVLWMWRRLPDFRSDGDAIAQFRLLIGL